MRPQNMGRTGVAVSLQADRKRSTTTYVSHPSRKAESGRPDKISDGDSRYTVFISERPSHTSISPSMKLRPT